jgi:hypothetical protein
MGVLLAVIFTLPPLVVMAHEVPDAPKRVESGHTMIPKLSPLSRVTLPAAPSCLCLKSAHPTCKRLGRRAELPGEVIELQSVDLRSAYLGDSNFRRAILGRSILARADLLVLICPTRGFDG